MSSDAKDVRTILVRGAREMARREGSRTIEAEHVLLAVAATAGDPAARLLADAGLTEDTIRAALDREWEDSLAVAGIAVRAGLLPQATPDHSRDPGIGESVRLLLERALNAEPKAGGTRIGSVRILAGILDAGRGRVARALQAAGVDRAALRARVAEALARGVR
ncbi:Clp protease [Kribbella turkmenica]|uniref:Clp protease n=1 Tax=Kribbella turkmenica TaxID=2530375 RepID=A0A4R4WGY9_9ACTN|nr:Clp protease N-terminal domain-containing protein [Kribbella turkmenica]TDD18202.1 Clp protease [Kribbella turkmenica]